MYTGLKPRIAAKIPGPLDLLLAAQRHQQHADGDTLHICPYLSLSREMGTGGSEIARKVARQLNWDVLDKEILNTIALRYGTPQVVLEFVDEKKVGWLADLFNGWIEGHGFSQLSYVHRLRHLFFEAVKRGNAVIVGRGARFILPRNKGLSVRIVAPFEFRVKRVMLENGISAAKARNIVEVSDYNRRAFIEKYFQRNVADPHLYDLIINVEHWSHDNAASLVCEAVHSWLSTMGAEETPGQL